MCSYNSPTFLFQPIELISLAAIARNEKIEVSLLDAIAENLTTHEVQEKIKEFNPSQIVCLTGFECIEEDIAELKNLKRVFPATQQIVFGHYASVFRKEIMELCDIDFIIHGEPDLIFKDLILYIKNKNSFSEIEGLSYRFEEKIVHNAIAGRIIYPNELPMPAFDLLKNNLYKEPFFPEPYGLIQSARGCPYQCNFCVKSYGTKLTTLTPENIILQLENYIQLFNIKAFRFIDDTFTAVPSRVIEFCKLLISKKLNLKWSCLARPDTLDSEMLSWMKEAGCSRLYIGVEAGSQKIIDALHKKFNIDEALINCKKAKNMGFELMGFFMVGHPKEKLEDVKKSLQFALKSGFSFISVSTLLPYPGTALYDQYKSEVNFSLVPYKDYFIDHQLAKKAKRHRRILTNRFYFHPKTWTLLSQLILTDRKSFMKNFFSFLKYSLLKKRNKMREDYI
jgi:radical SAM superfamily enzyme YgiQ (UPF0313 family)